MKPKRIPPSVSLIAFLVVFVFTGCTQNDLPLSGTIEGKVQITGDNFSSTAMPAEGILIFLADASQGLKVETSMVIDSIFTDGLGRFSFSGLPNGHYALLPVDTAQAYAFDLAEGTSSHEAVVSDAQKRIQLNYIAYMPVPENSGEVAYTVKVQHVNVPEAGEYFVYAQREEIRFLFGKAYSNCDTYTAGELTTSTFQLPAPYENWYEKQTNNLKILFRAQNPVWLLGIFKGYTEIQEEVVSVSVPLDNYESEYVLELDWETGTALGLEN